MTPWILLLIPAAFVLACPATGLMRRLGARLGQLDKPGERKIHTRPIPSTGGVAIFWAVALPCLAGLAAGWLVDENVWPRAVRPHIAGLKSQTPLAAALLGCVFALHVLGLIDDRKSLGPWSKLLVQFAVAAVPILFFDVRLLELLGTPASIAVTLLWFVAVTNAFNFLDNMDGLAGGVACICAGLLLASALIGGQWFVAALLALLIGALLGFLVFNFPPASIFMGDGGSLVVGYMLAFLSVRITYLQPVGDADRWWAVAAPLVVLAIPLYDLVSVTVLRLWQGRSPMSGDTQHFSHRLTRKGLSRRAAVGVIWACTLGAGLGGVMLPYLNLWQAALVVVQTLTVLFLLLLLEIKVKGNGS